MDILRTDALVIGAGPAGAVAAFQLARLGVDTLVIDRAIFPREKVCGESLSPGAFARLKAIGMWESPPPSKTNGVQSSHRITGMKIYSPSGVSFEGRYRSDSGLSGGALRRRVLDATLLDRVRDTGVRIIENVEATSAEFARGGEAIVQARDRAGRGTIRIEAKRVVVADGRRSFVARRLGFLEPNRRSDAHPRFAVRAHCEGLTGLTDLAEMHVGAGGYCGIAPLSDTSANICYVRFGSRLTMGPRTMERTFRDEIESYGAIAARASGVQIKECVRVIGPLRLVSRRQTRGPFIACGDATGFLDPFTGEGIGHAIASGVLAAEAVGRSLRGETEAFPDYEGCLRQLRRVKGPAALAVHALVSHRRLANATAAAFARVPGLANAAVRLFGDQI